MSGYDAYQQFSKLRDKRKKDEGWKESLYETMLHLALLGGKLYARTSGTTGSPMNIHIKRLDVIHSARLTADTFDLKEGDRALHCLPCEFIAGKMMLARAFALGLDLHIIDPRGSVLDNLRTEDRFRFTAMVPLQLHRALQEGRARVERQFDTILLGGGPVSDALIEDLQGLSTTVFLSYGSTETVTHVALRKLNGADGSDHFAAIGAVTFTIDPRGCLIIRTPHLSIKEHITNDLVELIDDHRFRWLGRRDNVILSGGKKIFPEQLEQRTSGLIPYPHFFTSFPEERLGQAVMLVLETEQPPQETLPEILERLVSVLQAHELPRRVTALRRFERTISGKIQRGRTLGEIGRARFP